MGIWLAPWWRFLVSLSTSLSPADLAGLVAKQLTNSFPDREVAASELGIYVDHALQRVEHCFSRILTKYYYWEGSAQFNHMMGDQYASFLYFLSNSIFRMEGDPDLAVRVYGLNKSLHGLDAYYQVELPDIFCFQHTVGTVLGRAQYSDYLFVYQRVTVGGNLKLEYPKIGEGVVLFGGVCVTGNCEVGDNVFVSINTTCTQQSIPGNSLVFGRSPDLTIKSTERSVIAEMFRHER